MSKKINWLVENTAPPTVDAKVCQEQVAAKVAKRCLHQTKSTTAMGWRRHLFKDAIEPPSSLGGLKQLVFQGLTTLSPRKVQSILERSQSIKTNRLYLFLSRYYAHPFVSRIDESRI